MRKPAVAGQFYSSDEIKLTNQITSCFKHNLGGGMPKIPLHKGRIFGAIAPHAGYEYSGACASHAYREIAGDFPETFVILGTNHSGRGNALFSLSLEDFETPLGIVKNDVEFGNALVEAGSVLGLQQDEAAHKSEHSVEVQLPFLQFIAKMIKKDFSIVPIVVSTIDFESCAKAAEIIAKVSQEQNRKICVIASGDFTHYGANYGFAPFKENVKNNLYALDKKSINHILKLDSLAFYDEATKTTICGTGPVVVCMEACKHLGAKKAMLLKYCTSGDISGDYSNAVGYASIIIE